MRFSLPSQLLEPTPNLEYWTYLDAPNAFVAIGTSDEPLDRMLEVVRFWLTKDLKYAKGKPCKPYNSCLGEFFRVRRTPLFLPRGAVCRHVGGNDAAAGKTKVLHPSGPLADFARSVTGRPRTMRRGSIPRS